MKIIIIGANRSVSEAEVERLNSGDVLRISKEFVLHHDFYLPTISIYLKMHRLDKLL